MPGRIYKPPMGKAWLVCIVPSQIVTRFRHLPGILCLNNIGPLANMHRAAAKATEPLSHGRPRIFAKAQKGPCAEVEVPKQVDSLQFVGFMAVSS